MRAPRIWSHPGRTNTLEPFWVTWHEPFGSTDAGAGNCLDLESRYVDGHHLWLVLDFDTEPGHAWNAFEGCCAVVGDYYAVWPQYQAADDYQMLLTLPCQQYWVETNGLTPGMDGWKVTSVWSEVEKP